MQLDAAMPAIQGLQAVLANLADTIDANWQGAIDDLDIEFLHELRVATRRSRSVLAHGHDVLPAWVVADARQRLAWVGRLTGPARDLDVYVTEWDAYVAPLGADALNRLTPALAILESRRAAAHRALEDGLRSDTAIQHMVTWRHQLTRLAALEPRGPHADRVLGRVVARRIVTAHRRLIERGGRIDAATPAARLHALRKDGKELRYLVECFGGLLAEGPRKRYVRRLSALQDVLGAHQDAEIHLGVAHDLAATLHAGGADHTTMLALGRLCERLAQAQLRSRRAFARQFDDYRSDKTVDALDALLCHLRS